MAATQPSPSFVRSIIEDVAAAIHRADQSGTDESRRSAIRTVAAAIEGLVWHYRETVIWAASGTGVMDDADHQALLETSYSIDARGNVQEQPRFVPSQSMLRFLARLAHRVTLHATIGFDDNRWNSLNETIKIRNRITHPKSEKDVMVDNADVDRAFSAFDWLLQSLISSMDALNSVMVEHVAELRYVLEKLRDDDAAYMTEYRRIKQSDD